MTLCALTGIAIAAPILLPAGTKSLPLAVLDPEQATDGGRRVCADSSTQAGDRIWITRLAIISFVFAA